ncbi:LANC3-like protein [Mya arenaria]|uniref:LANC3-like protein n=1 Tax=Mya arenaria TaxID=6604 RepID=A0ABY7EFH5_MYAAR|nr:lanC-like protein 3 [Mya arenaria]WAR07557.1 LANC3-like protein [Mya arenaria]
MRFFENKFPEYKEDVKVVIDVSKWMPQVCQIAESILQGMPATLENCDGGLYVGNAGIAYMFYYLAQNEAFKDMRSIFLERAIIYSNIAQEHVAASQQDKASFLLGVAGVHAVSGLIHENIGSTKDASILLDKFSSIADVCTPMNFLRCGSDELFVGRAGYLCGVMNLHQKLGRKVVSDAAVQKLCEVTLESGRQYASRTPNIPLMYAYYNTEYLGAAHGLSSILQMLLCFPSFVKSSPDTEALLKSGVDFLLSLEQENGNFPPAMDEVKSRRPDKEELVHWCHGAPGVVYLLARAYRVWGDVKYLEACLRCGELTWKRGLLKKGPGICHGVAGSGYVFLLLYRLTGDEKHLYRALKFAEFLFSHEFQGARIPDSPYSLYEGWAGTVCFLADLLQPQNAEFPLFNVFLE